MRPSRRTFYCAGACLVVLAACSASVDDPPLVPVTGVVTYRGDLVIGASVVFYPAAGAGLPKPVQGVTGTDGRFSLRSHIEKEKYRPGALPGNYTVVISKTEHVPFPTGTMVPPRQLLPRRYLDPRASPLKAVVEPARENHFPFVLED